MENRYKRPRICEANGDMKFSSDCLFAFIKEDREKAKEEKDQVSRELKALLTKHSQHLKVQTDENGRKTILTSTGQSITYNAGAIRAFIGGKSFNKWLNGQSFEAFERYGITPSLEKPGFMVCSLTGDYFKNSNKSNLVQHIQSKRYLE